MGIVYALVNQKGGTGKTTTAVNLSASFADAGRRVLLVDMDPQGNATSGMGIDKSALALTRDSRQLSTYDVLVHGSSICDAALNTPVPGAQIVGASLDLAGAEVELLPHITRETVLRSALESARDQYDYILIDAPPALGLLTINALVAADAVIIPIQCEYYALEGVSQLLQTMEIVRRQLNPGLHIGHVVLTMYDNRVRLNRLVVEEVRQAFRDKVARRIVPRNVRIAEAPSHGLPISRYDPRSQGAAAYREIAMEIMRNGKASSG